MFQCLGSHRMPTAMVASCANTTERLLLYSWSKEAPPKEAAKAFFEPFGFFQRQHSLIDRLNSIYTVLCLQQQLQYAHSREKWSSGGFCVSSVLCIQCERSFPLPLLCIIACTDLPLFHETQPLALKLNCFKTVLRKVGLILKFFWVHFGFRD